MTDPSERDRALELARVGTIATIIADSKGKLLNSYDTHYFTIDTGFLTPEGFPGMWQWMSGKLRDLVELSSAVAAESVPHRFHRLFLVPDPAEYANNFQRIYYRKLVQDILHFHMWHGVVAYVVFMQRKNYDTAAVLRALDFGAVGPKLVYDTANYYARTFRGLRVVEGDSANLYIRTALGIVRSSDLRNVLRLYYDPKTFEHARRNDAQWETLRNFFFRLQSGICPGPECAAQIPRNQAELDHIIPREASNNVLLNLRVLCQSCNQNKGKLQTYELPFATAYEIIPPDIATKEIQHIIADSEPPWLARYTRQPINILRRLEI